MGIGCPALERGIGPAIGCALFADEFLKAGKEPYLFLQLRLQKSSLRVNHLRTQDASQALLGGVDCAGVLQEVCE